MCCFGKTHIKHLTILVYYQAVKRFLCKPIHRLTKSLTSTRTSTCTGALFPNASGSLLLIASFHCTIDHDASRHLFLHSIHAQPNSSVDSVPVLVPVPFFFRSLHGCHCSIGHTLVDFFFLASLYWRTSIRSMNNCCHKGCQQFQLPPC